MSERYRSFSSQIIGQVATRELSWVVVERVGSTNSLARRIVQRWPSGPRRPPATALIAWHQSAGRGRGNRSWESRAGEGIWASLAVPVVAGRHLGLLPLIAGMALIDVLRSVVDNDLRLKWPNDIYVGGAKMGGVLIEAVSRGDKATAIIGFGINYGLDPPTFSDHRTTSISLESASPPALAFLTVSVVEAVFAAVRRPLRPGELLPRMRRFSLHRPGDSIRLVTTAGDLTGRFHDIDENGLLLLETDDGIERISGGEVLGG